MTQTEEKIGEILQSLGRIEKALRIVPDIELDVSNTEESILAYEKYARDELHLEENTIQNQKSAIQAFLKHSGGHVGRDLVKAYLDSNPSPSWRTGQVKALRRYTRDFLKLGRWMEEFRFEKSGPRIQVQYPDNAYLTAFYKMLPSDSQPVFLVLLNSGLRSGEVLGLRINGIDIVEETNMIDASNIHQGSTKHSWISFVTNQTADILIEYWDKVGRIEDSNNMAFSVSMRTLQEHFTTTSKQLGIDITPKLLRKIFADRCERAGINKKYIDAFCGRTPKGVLETHYTDYSPAKLREEYDKVESLLTLDLDTDSDIA